MLHRVASRWFCGLVLAAAWLAVPPDGQAQWDDNCARGCVKAFVGCLGSSGCTYQSCHGGEQCIAGQCCVDGRCGGTCGFRPAGCDTPCLLERGECVGGCVPLIPGPELLVALPPQLLGPLVQELEAAEIMLSKGLGSLVPQVLQHLGKARAELQTLVKQQKIDAATAAALEASLAETESALLGGGLRQCAAELVNPDGLGKIDRP